MLPPNWISPIREFVYVRVFLKQAVNPVGANQTGFPWRRRVWTDGEVQEEAFRNLNRVLVLENEAVCWSMVEAGRLVMSIEVPRRSGGFYHSLWARIWITCCGFSPFTYV